MMNRIYKDLQDNIQKIYSGYNVITINNYLHHSFNYQEAKDLYLKYKGDVKILTNRLYAHINQYENKPYEMKKKTRFQGIPHSIIDNFFEDLQEEIRQELDPNSVFADKDVNTMMKLAQQFEIKKIQKKAQETGQILQPDDISIQSVLRSIIEIAKSNQKYAHIFNAIKESGFDIEKFIQDDEQGKSNQESFIKKYCTNLNEKAESGKLLKVIGREKEIEQIVNILSKARKNNPILTGLAGTGKTAIVEGLAKKIIEKDVPKSLENAVIYELQVMNMVKGTTYRGQFEQNMSDLLNEFKEKEESGEFPILFIDELHTIMGAGSGGQGGLDFSNIIKPALARGELRTIGATTTDEWYKFIKENPALDRRFVPVTVIEPSFKDAVKIITESLSYYEKNHNVTYDKGTVERAVELSQQFIVDNALPDKAFDLIDYAGAMVSINKGNKVTNTDIEIALARQKNVDLEAIVESRKDNLEPIAPKLKKIIFGQDSAVEKVSRPIQKALAGLNPKDKPLASFLFTGPTGTGKTELAKQLAKEMRAGFHRIDCSELQERHSISKLIGSPAGYVGYDDGSSLTKILNNNPRTVLLLDEIEKAHPDIYKLFLQAMDYGKITDSKGKEINFKNVVIIMTSNAGVVNKENKKIGLSNSKTQSIDMSVIESLFAEEFRGRLTGNGPIEFQKLSIETMKQIVMKYINEIQEERLNSKKIELVLSDEAVSFLAQKGLDKDLGARPVKDFIESHIMDELSDEILFGKLKNINKIKKVKVDLVDNQIKLKI